MARKGSLPVLGKFPGSKLTILAGSLASLGVISGALALPRPEAVEEAPAAAEMAAAPAAPVDVSQPAPQIIRRVYVIRRSSSADAGTSSSAAAAPAKAKTAGSPKSALPPAAEPAPAPANPTPQPVTKSRGS